MIGATTPAAHRTRLVAGIILVVAAATILSALATQYVGGLIPCKLCLWQRKPYYGGVPLAALVLIAPASWRRYGLGLLALLFLASAALGAYHAGVEWGIFLGPSDCGGGVANDAATSMEDFLKQLDSLRVVSCTDAAWRLLGLSLAGWNTLVSIWLAALAGWAALARERAVV